MRRQALTLTTGCTLMLLVATANHRAIAAQTAADTRRSVWDAVYTDAQATRGDAVYQQRCVGCHRTDLLGDGYASPLVGADFIKRWNEKSIGDLYQRVRLTMPLNAPNMLTTEQYIDVVALLLRANEFPTGAAELSANLDTLKSIELRESR